MKQKFMMGAVVAVVLVLIAAYALGAFGSGGDNTKQMTATVYLEEVSTGDVYSAEIDMGAPSSAEAMMLAFGQGIRSAQFQPLQSTPGTDGGLMLYKNGVYKMYAKVTFKIISGTGMKSYDKAVLELKGTAGAASTSTTPDHLTSTNPLYSSGAGAAVVGIHLNQALALNTDYTLSNYESGSDKRFDKFQSGTTYTVLTGDTIDNCMIQVTLTVSGTGLDGNVASATATAQMQFVVTDYATSSLSILITDFSASGPQATA